MILSLKEQLNNLRHMLYQLDMEQYAYKSAMLSDASIGQHVRHIIELVQCLLSGYEDGAVDYDQRKRDVRIETDKHFALQLLNELRYSIDRPEKTLRLRISAGNRVCMVETGYSREIFYNTEHAIHHMALIRVALREMNLDVVHESFGVAYSTMQHKQKLSA